MLSLFSHAYADTLYWDGNVTQTANANGGAGTWDNGTTSNWDNTPLAGVDSTWTNANFDTAVFGSTAGTVTLGDNISVGGLTFDTSAYVINANTNAKTLTFGATDNTIRLGNVAAATITGTVAGTGNVTLTSNPTIAGTLTLNGTSTGGWSGTTTINAGTTMALAASNQALLNTSGITLNGGGITLTNTAAGSENTIDRVSDSAAIASYGNGTISIANTSTAARNYTENMGVITHYNGQLSVGFTTNQAGTQTLTLAGLTRSGSTSTIAVSGGGSGAASINGNSFIWVNGVTSNTAAGEIVGPWMTAGTNATTQSDWGVYSSSDGSKARITSAAIAASAQSTWTATHAMTSNYTLNTNTVVNPENGRLTSDRMINTLRTSSGDSSSLTVDAGTDYITMASNNFQNGDVVLSRNTTGGALTQGRVYYVINKDGAGADTFQVSATSGGAAVNLTTTAAGFLTAGVNLNGNTLGTYGVLTGSTSIHGIGGGAGSKLTLATTTSGNLYLQAAASSLWVDVPITDNGAGVLTLVKGGTGALTLNGDNTYTGGTVINAGTLTFTTLAAGNDGTGQNITFGGTATLDTGVNGWDGAQLTVSAGAVGTIAGRTVDFTSTTGSGTIIHASGNAVLNLGNASAFTGSIRKDAGNNGGAVQFSALSDASGAGNLIFAGGSGDSNQRITMLFNGSSDLTFQNRSIELLPRGAAINWSFRNAILENNSSGTTKWVIETDLVNRTDRNHEFTLGGSNAGNNEFSGKIGDSTRGTFYNGTGALSLFKAGTGKWIVSGANTFTGLVIVNNGTLSVANINESNAAGALGMGSTIQLGGQDPAGGAVYLPGGNSGTLEYTGNGQTSTRSFRIGDNVTAGNTGGGGIANNGTSGALVFSNASFNTAVGTATGDRTLTLSGSNTAANEIQGAIVDNSTTGNIFLAKSGTGNWALTGTNTYTGTTVVNGGTLQFAKQESLYNNTAANWTAANINVKSGATFAVNVDSAAAAGFDSGNLDTLLTNISVANTAVQGLQAGATLGFDTSTATGGTFTQGNAIANSTGSFGGTIGLTKLGTGTLVLDKANTYTGATTIQAGTLLLGSNDRLSNSTPVTVAGGILDVSTFTNTVASFSMSSGALNGTGTLTAATYMLTGGTLAANLGAGAVTVNGDVNFSAAGRLNVASTLLIQGGTLTLSGNESVNSFQQTGGTVAGGFTINSATDSDLQSGTFSGNLAGSGGINKTGDGTTTITGTNSYTGATNVTSGTLVVNGNIASSSLTTVASGATIGGSGTVGVLNVSSGAFINPGNSPGILNTGNYTQVGTYSAEITGIVAGTEHDQINVTGTVDIAGGSLTTLFSAGTYAENDLIFILLNDGVDAITGTYTGLADGALVTSFGGFDWTISYFADSTVGPSGSFTGGNDIALRANAIPEPNVAALLGCLGVILILRRRR